MDAHALLPARVVVATSASPRRRRPRAPRRYRAMSRHRLDGSKGGRGAAVPSPSPRPERRSRHPAGHWPATRRNVPRRPGPAKGHQYSRLRLHEQADQPEHTPRSRNRSGRSRQARGRGASPESGGLEARCGGRLPPGPLPRNHDLFYHHACPAHCPPPPGGKPLVDSALLSAARSGLILVNTARASLVDEVALGLAIDQGKVSGYCVDVFDTEPPQLPGLASRQEVIATSHIGGYTEESVSRATEFAIANLMDALRMGEHPF